MKLIATHNSGTGEPSKNWFYRLMTPIAKCQFGTIAEQYMHGCSYLDLRVRECDDSGHYRLCHGLWRSKTTLDEALQTLTELSIEHDRPIVTLFYEGSLTDEEHQQWFLADMMRYKKEYPNVEVAIIGVKKPTWHNLVVYRDVPIYSDFAKITGWRAFIPFPILHWYFRHSPAFNNDVYTMVDFL